jgi:hypothetical protein
MSHTRAAVMLSGVVLAAIVALSFVTKPRATVSEKDRAAVEEAADRLTHKQIADAWTQTKLGNTRPMQDIKRTFPFPPRTVYEDGAAIILVFAGHNQTCIDFRTQPDEGIVSARHC